jgi:hypothetical protein
VLPDHSLLKAAATLDVLETFVSRWVVMTRVRHRHAYGCRFMWRRRRGPTVFDKAMRDFSC